MYETGERKKGKEDGICCERWNVFENRVLDGAKFESTVGILAKTDQTGSSNMV